jgi:hypothetical protein
MMKVLIGLRVVVVLLDQTVGSCPVFLITAGAVEVAWRANDSDVQEKPPSVSRMSTRRRWFQPERGVPRDRASYGEHRGVVAHRPVRHQVIDVLAHTALIAFLRAGSLIWTCGRNETRDAAGDHCLARGDVAASIGPQA